MKPMTRVSRPFLLPVLFIATMWSGCGPDDLSDAFGNFEATEVTVSAGMRGQLIAFDVREGSSMMEGDIVGLVDTTQVALQRQSLVAQRRSTEAQQRATLAQIREVEAQGKVLDIQLETALTEQGRTERLLERNAATDRELTQRTAEVRSLERQREQTAARIASIREQANSIGAQARQFDARIAEVDALLDDARVVNPQTGTVLSVMARRGEMVAPGTPLYTIAETNRLVLKAFATGDQLPDVRLGATVEVLVDGGGGRLDTLSGSVTWIASRAQFTPTPIQTRDERAELVYAFDVSVQNPDGRLKIGMPGEVNFRP